jgi:hypothetical protein
MQIPACKLTGQVIFQVYNPSPICMLHFAFFMLHSPSCYRRMPSQDGIMEAIARCRAPVAGRSCRGGGGLRVRRANGL